MSIITKKTSRSGTTPATGREHGEVAPSTSTKLGTKKVAPTPIRATTNPNLKLRPSAESIRIV